MRIFYGGIQGERVQACGLTAAQAVVCRAFSRGIQEDSVNGNREGEPEKCACLPQAELNAWFVLW